MSYFERGRRTGDTPAESLPLIMNHCLCFKREMLLLKGMSSLTLPGLLTYSKTFVYIMRERNRKNFKIMDYGIRDCMRSVHPTHNVCCQHK